MKSLDLPEYLADKIYEIKTGEKKELQNILGDRFASGVFYSIFSDVISDDDWEKAKAQIKKRFQEDLFDIDKTNL